MTIQTNLAKQGAFLFRWRSYLPLVLLMPGMMALSDSALFEERYGERIDEIWALTGFVIAIAGLAIRWMTVGFVPAGTSGRNTKEQRAHALNTDGLYSVVKNPLYLGNYFTILGVLVSLKVWWLVMIGSLAYWIYIERIIAAEEEFLTMEYGDEYSRWADRTPVFIPDFRLWRKPAMKFSLKTVLRREYNGFMGVCAAFFLTELIVDVFVEGEPLRFWIREDWPWVWGFCAALTIFLTLRTLKKHTSVLKVSGR